MLGKAIYAKIKENRQAKIENAIATEVINVLTNLVKDGKGKMTVNQVIETYRTKNCNTEK